MPATSNKFRTNDMVLATLLYMDGHEYVHELEVHRRADARHRRGCTWVFDAPGGDEDRAEFEALIEEFMNSTAEVEPREFARVWAEVRRAMFSFLGHQR